MENQKIEISTGIVLRTILILIGIWFLYLIKDILALLFIAVLIVAVIDPAVDWMQRKRIPRTAGVLIMFFLIALVLGLSVAFLIPPLVDQFKDFGANFSNYFQRIEASFYGVLSYFESQNINIDIQQLADNFSGLIAGFPNKVFSGTIGVFSGFVSILIVFALAFYMSVVENSIRKFIVLITPAKHHEYAVSLTERIKAKIGKWMQGQMLLMLVVFLLDLIGLYIIGVPYALALAIFAGIMEIIPYVGPIISAIPAVILGFIISPLTGLLVLLLFVIVQQLENNVISPQIMKKTVGLNPIVVIISILVGAKIAGFLGVVFAIPVAAAASVFVGDFFNKK
ncbi:MAG: hypothetical protein COU40_02705 [Candidatus Moranbacteria bacterium CG10_big_fil_rev_8_21_14_0_10_35_21]|nr:MAG: hypothetical protein COU40_02705 [Candidatus Moranbacteria bacterium CG10_big_fil_rev_8_21_14_0_10_35_21]PJA88373.1 MAG: hypothetical protein CO139_03440 [Candidatus Moranbacteria bacterium CG_4_9_14_3_um_filter_36_9]